MTPQPPIDPEEGDIFNPAQLDRLVSLGSKQRQQIIQLISDFIKKWPAEVERSEQLFKQGDQKEAARILHTLRGSCGTVGAKKLVDSSFRAEKSMPEVPEETTLANISEVKKDLDKMLQLASVWLNSIESEPPQPETDTDFDQTKIQRLIEHLEAQNMEALSLYPELKPSLDMHMTPDALEELDEAVHQLNFNSAAQILKQTKFH
ncbi:Hpt domain-containing protein [Hahella ganghwensis]|uniref:Hpt domain-containing protein n=1 Tax=Hahella ganghwensis TaxID=286420 RepID=UPI0003740F42|nr:Hpt domain-containing protein [Hahella ganghwensis]